MKFVRGVKGLLPTHKPAAEKLSPAAPTVPVVSPPPSIPTGSHSSRVSAPDHQPRPCCNNCGWTAFGTFKTCCQMCKGPDGPHAADCSMKNKFTRRLCELGCGRPANGRHRTCCRMCTGPDGQHDHTCGTIPQSQPIPGSTRTSEPSSPSVPAVVRPERRSSASHPLCSCGCSRPAFASFSTCCIRCKGPDGPHAADCARKAGLEDADVGASPSLPKTAEEVLEALRSKLAEWHVAGCVTKRAEVEELITTFAGSAGMDREGVRMLWLQAARQARPVGAPAAQYVALARRHHGVDLEVIDLGGGSTKHHNSCMFLTCAVSLADRRQRGYDFPRGPLGAQLEAACPETNAAEPVEELIAQHRRTKSGTLGRMADALRSAACQALLLDAEFFRPFFSPIRGGGSDKKAYEAWVRKMEGDEEGDELVMLVLCRLLRIAVQPVQQSGYRVPLMDPVGVAEKEGVSYWGNDDRHWVWLQEAQKTHLPSGSPHRAEVPAPPPEETPPVVAAPETPAAMPCASSTKPSLPVSSAPEQPVPKPRAQTLHPARPPASTIAFPAAQPSPSKSPPVSKGATEYPVGLF